MQLFYAPEIATTPFLPEEESLHCIKVLRMHEDDEIHIIDGYGTLYKARIISAHIKHTEVDIIEATHDYGARPYRLHLAVAPTKNIDRFEWFVEKSTEFGFDTLIPLECRYSERRIIKPERIEKIIVSASKQSLKAKMPVLKPMTPFSEFVKHADATSKFIAHCHDMPKEHLMKTCPKGGDIVVAIGPEGDFSTEEVSDALDTGFQAISLGTSRLRTETAGIAACHIVSLANLR